MKKTLLLSLLTIGHLYASSYQANATATASSKKEACSQALSTAKEEALNQAGTFMISDFSSSTSVNKDDVKELSSHKLRALSVGTIKVVSKREKVTVEKNYTFECRVDATFSIDEEQMKTEIKNYLQSQKQDTKLIKAIGYSEEGQSRYRAFKAAELDAKRNLVDEIKGSHIISLLESQDGKLATDKVINGLETQIRYVKVLSKKYDSVHRSATVEVGLREIDLKKNISEWKE